MTSSADGMIAIVRAVHFGAVIVLFGQFVFLFVISRPNAPPNFARIAAWSLGIALASAVAWLALEAPAMSGLPLREALGRDTLAVVLTQTLFGRVWLVRAALAAALCVALWRRTAAARPGAVQALGALLAATLLATLSGTGHAAAERGLERMAHLCADALHLLAAGAWLGALIPLVALLSRSASAQSLGFAAQATRRFSTLGLAAMAALLLSGVVNATYAVSDISALFASQYGRLLLAKVVLFTFIIGFAARNRLILMPQLSSGAARALRELRRNALAEAALGFAIIAVVGKLGMTVPAMHSHGEEDHAHQGLYSTESQETAFGRAVDPGTARRTVRVVMTEFSFQPAEITVHQGDVVRFIAINRGQVAHEMVLGTLDDLKEHAELMRTTPEMEHAAANMAQVAPGKSGPIDWQFTKAGEFYYGCLVPGHFEAGMVGRVTVLAKAHREH